MREWVSFVDASRRIDVKIALCVAPYWCLSAHCCYIIVLCETVLKSITLYLSMHYKVGMIPAMLMYTNVGQCSKERAF